MYSFNKREHNCQDYKTRKQSAGLLCELRLRFVSVGAGRSRVLISSAPGGIWQTQGNLYWNFHHGLFCRCLLTKSRLWGEGDMQCAGRARVMCVLLHSSRFSVVLVCAMVGAGLDGGEAAHSSKQKNQKAQLEYMLKRFSLNRLSTCFVGICWQQS